MNAEIMKIKLRIGDRDIELTAEEAREVQKELNRLFEVEKTNFQKIQDELDKLQKTVPQKEYVPYPVYPAPYPVPFDPYWPRRYEIWCGTTGGGMTI